jgi:FlaA1/EpsC-like NDP-sugar epimerase
MPRLRNRHLFALDALLLSVLPFILYAVRFESFSWEPDHVRTAVVYVACVVPAQLAIFLFLGLYGRLWRYASITELELIIIAGLAAGTVNVVLGAVVLPEFGLAPKRVPLSVLFSASLFAVGMLAVPRLLIRVGDRRRARGFRPLDGDRRVLIAGAGMAGEMVVRELLSNPELRMNPIGFVDDDVLKHGMRLNNLPVFGSLATIRDTVQSHNVSEILIAMPRAPGEVVRRVVREAFRAGIRTKIVPGLFEILSERASVSAIREVQIEDLLRRDPIQTDLADVARLAEGKTVLVTGGGGSIGSELCRQLAVLKPKALLVLDHGENPVFEIAAELERAHLKCPVIPVIADIRDRRRISQVFAQHRPFAVFHAAAHKHVPLMECNVVEAVTNNIMGTRNLVDAATAAGVQHFVFISTDKAVRPTNIMGATKRVAEFIVHNAALQHGRNFVSVRFGNVLGSQGSVVPIFARQIRAGGPVTVTHPEMRRYFMTIPEAVQLVLQAGSMGRGGELFMLDMGEPVRVVDLARDMIRLSGLEAETDIEIQFTGIRPGEKLYEEMFFSHEVAQPTEHPKILRARNGIAHGCSDSLIEQLIQQATAGSPDNVLRGLLMQAVPDFATATPMNVMAGVASDVEERVPHKPLVKTAPRSSSAPEASPA